MVVFDINNQKILWIMSVICFLVFPVSMILKRVLSDFGIGIASYFSDLFYSFATYLLWFMFISFSIFCIFRIIHKIIPNQKIWFFFAILVIFLFSYSVYNAKNIQTKNITITSPKINQDIKIAYMSDVHIHTNSQKSFISKIAQKIKEQNVDLILINWDFIDWIWLDYNIFSPLEELNIPIFLSMWNHEIYAWSWYVYDLISKTKIKLLIDKKINFWWIDFYFADEAWDTKKDTKKLENFLGKEISDKKWYLDNFSVLVLHQPSGVDIASSYWFDLQLAWHTHWWQIWPFNLLVRFAFDYVYGMYNIWNMNLFVSYWIWTWWPNMRLWTKSELVIFDIKK